MDPGVYLSIFFNERGGGIQENGMFQCALGKKMSRLL